MSEWLKQAMATVYSKDGLKGIALLVLLGVLVLMALRYLGMV